MTSTTPFRSPSPCGTDESVAGEEDPGASLDQPSPAYSPVPHDPGHAEDGAVADVAEALCCVCGGSGRLADAPCPECGGSGKVLAGLGGA